MIRSALVICCVAGRNLAPVCKFESESGNWSVYNSEQWSRRLPVEIDYEEGGYHNLTCFKKAELPGVHDLREAELSIGKASKMYAVQNDHIELDHSDICYGWPETEPQFTRGPSLSEIERKYSRTWSSNNNNFGKCAKTDECKDYILEGGMNDSLANICIKNLPVGCSVEQKYKMVSLAVPPYKGTGRKVQSFSGLAILNYDIVPQRYGTKLMIPQSAKLNFVLKKHRPIDCRLLLSAYSPVTGKSLPIDYVHVDNYRDLNYYILNKTITASLFNMGEFDFQLINNNRRRPCKDDDVVLYIHSASEFSTIADSKEPVYLKNKVCQDGSLEISFLETNMTELDKSIDWYPNYDFDLPIKIHLKYRNKYSADQIDKWEVYETLHGEDICSMRPDPPENNREVGPAKWTPLRGDILSKSVSTGTDKDDGTVVTVELAVKLRSERDIPTFIQIPNVGIDPQDIPEATVTLGDPWSERLQPKNDLDYIAKKESMPSLPVTFMSEATVTLGDPWSERLQPKNDLDGIAKKESMLSVPVSVIISTTTHLRQTSFKFTPLKLSKPIESSRDLRSWNTLYLNKDLTDDCGVCFTLTFRLRKPADESFWDCRSRCKVDDTGFTVLRFATFLVSEIPRFRGVSPPSMNIEGYAIDLDLPPCAQANTQLNYVTVVVLYNDVSSNNIKCLEELMGALLLNVPEYTGKQDERIWELGFSYRLQKHRSTNIAIEEYHFNTSLFAETLPRSLVIGYDKERSLSLCVGMIGKIIVSYELEYKKRSRRNLAPVCEFESKSGNWSVYNSEQWSRRLPVEIEYEVGEYHNLKCFKKTELPGVQDLKEAELSIGKASKLYAVKNGNIELDRSDICYGWPETEPQFTRGPSLSQIEREYSRRWYSDKNYVQECAKTDECKNYILEGGMNDSLANICINNLPVGCSVKQNYLMESVRVPPYKGTGRKVQSFSGLAILNYDIVPQRNGTKLMVPGVTRLDFVLKEHRPIDCRLLLSAYSPVTGKSLPIYYVYVTNYYRPLNSYILNKQITATLFNMGDFDFQLINNHRKHPCIEDDVILYIQSEGEFTTIVESNEPVYLENGVCEDGSLEISFMEMEEVDKSLDLYPNYDFELPIKIQLKYRNKYSSEQINKWEVYESAKFNGLCWFDRKGIRLVEWTPLRGTIFSKRVSTGTEKDDGTVVTVELAVKFIKRERGIPHYLQRERDIAYFIQIPNVRTDPQDTPEATVTLGDPWSERLQPKNDLDGIAKKESMSSLPVTVDIITHLRKPGFKFTPLKLWKPIESSRDLKSWVTVYRNKDRINDCGDCETVTSPLSTREIGDESFWDCRSRCKVDDTGFTVSRSANFSISEIPRLRGAEPNEEIFGYAIDLGLPPCAQSNTQFNSVTVTVTYNISTYLNSVKYNSNCLWKQVGALVLNVPEYTSSVYFERINGQRAWNLGITNRKDIQGIDSTGKAIHIYNFNPDRALPRSLVIGYFREFQSCVDPIDSIMVSYELEYTPLKSNTD